MGDGESDNQSGGLGHRSDDAPDFTAPRDYSGSHDYSAPNAEDISLANAKDDEDYNRRLRANMAENYRLHGENLGKISDSLRNGEQADKPDNSSRDIGHQEHSNWNNKAGSDLGHALDNNTSGNGNKSGSVWGRHKKGIIGWVIGIAMGGGMFGVTTILSGPAQWIQVMNFVKDMTSWVNGAQTGARYLHNLRTMAKWESKLSDSIQNSRLGIVGKKAAKTAIERMKEKGMTFDDRWNGNAPSITVDTTVEYGNLFNQDAKGGTASDAVKQKRLETLSSKYGVDIDKIKLGSDGKMTINFDEMSYREARKFISATNNVGKFSILGQVQTRLALKKVGKISWLHPIRKLEQKVYNKFADWLKDRMEKIAKNGFGSADEAAAAARKNAEFAGKNADEIEKAAKAAKEGWEKGVKEAAEEISTKVIKFAIEKTGAKVSVSAVKAAIPIVGWITLAIQAYCMVVGLDDGIGAEKYQTVVTTAEGSSAETLGLGSQVMTGQSQDEDLNLTDLGMLTQLKLYNPDVEQVSPTTDPNNGEENEGYKTVGTTSSSWWDAAPVQAALGITPSTASMNDVPAALNDVTNAGLSFGGSKDLQNIWNIFSSTVEFAGNGIVGAAMKVIGLPTPMEVVCYVFDQIDAVIGGIFGWILEKTGLMNLLTGLPFMDALGNLMMNIMGWLRGSPLNVATSTPQQFGSIDMYGGTFTSNEQMLAVGGRIMDSDEQQQLVYDQKQYLAEMQAQKPLLARIFDPSDYNSTIAQVGRAAGIDTSNQSIGTQIKNVGKIFASVPRLFSFALGKIGGNAYAADVPYNYNVPMVAFSKAEMAKLVGGDPSYDIIPNAEKVFSMIDDGQITSDKTMKCWGVTITGSPSYTITQADNSAGAAWNYGDNSGEAGVKMKDNGCQGDDMLRFRTYMMDYNITVAADCYENDGWSGGDSADSCAEMGFDLGSSAASNVASGKCAEGTTDLGTYDNAHENGKKVSVELCEVGSISLSEPAFYTSEDPEIFRSAKTGVIVNAEVSEAFQKMGEAAKAAGVQLSGKGIRSYEKQEYFWNCYQTKKCNNGNEAAKPGTSQHESGRAIDFSAGSISWLQKNAIEFGICATVASENWHYSPKNGKACYHGSE